MPLDNERQRKRQLGVSHGVLLGIYMASNVAAAVTTLVTNELGGDFAGFDAPSNFATLVIAIGIIGSFILVMNLAFNFFKKIISIDWKTFDSRHPSFKLSFFVLTVQIVFLTYSLYYGAGVAGVTSKNESPIKYLFYVVSADFLFLFYFASSLPNRFTILNAVIFAASNVLRGWSSWYLYLGWLILVKSVWRRKISFKLVFFSAATGLLLLPAIMFMKLYFRLIATGADYSSIASSLNIDLLDITEIYADSLIQLFQRFQHFSSVAVLLNNLDVLREQFHAGFIRVFYLEGFVGFFLNRVFDLSAANELNTVVISTLLNTDLLESSYATHVGAIGWMLVAYEYIPIYLAYLAFLMLSSHLLVKYSKSKEVNELNWLIWLLLLMHGWFGAFTNFLVTGFIYFFIARRLQSSE